MVELDEELGPFTTPLLPPTLMMGVVGSTIPAGNADTTPAAEGDVDGVAEADGGVDSDALSLRLCSDGGGERSPGGVVNTSCCCCCCCCCWQLLRDGVLVLLCW